MVSGWWCDSVVGGGIVIEFVVYVCVGDVFIARQW